MWKPFKKEPKKTGIKLSPGESMDINFLTSWRKNEVVIMTNNGPIVLDGSNELFIEVTANNIDPVKLQIVPDFKNRVLNFVEIIDPNAKKKYTPTINGPRLAFTGYMIKEKNISFSDYLKNWDKDIEQFDKVVKRSKLIRYTFIPINIILFLWNSYLFLTKNDTIRYFNLFAAITSAYLVYYIYNSHKKFYKNFKEYKELREKTFGIVKKT